MIRQIVFQKNKMCCTVPIFNNKVTLTFKLIRFELIT